MQNGMANNAMTNGMGHMNSNMMIDNFKSMMLTMAMVKGTNQSDSNSNSFLNTILLMFLVSFMDTIALQAKKIFSVLSTTIENYITKKTNNISLINKLTTSYNSLKTKKSSIIIKIESASKNPTSDAIIDMLTHLPDTKCILLNNGIYTINYSEEIEISKCVFAKLVSSSSSQMIDYNNDKNTPPPDKIEGSNQQLEPIMPDKEPEDAKCGGFGYIDIYSYTIDMELLRNEVNNIVKNYLIKMTNKLGNNIYYFSEMPANVYRDGQGKIDHSKSMDSLHFTMKQFITNRSFKNLFGKDINIIRKRVEFFRDNKSWYDNKGVPYTLGILVSGNPGSGKTSIIKCIANELKRHIINIHLSDNMTKTQIENLFYNEQIHVTQNGKTDTYTIPINKRIYVLEDVDCQCEIILDRGNQTAEQVLAKKNNELKEEIEKLKFALSEMSNGKKVVMANNNAPQLEQKKEDGSNQKITLSFLLNLFDGVLETPGRITFMTTNFLDKLDKAFTRPGRIDVIGKFGFADNTQLMEIIEHRYDVKLTEEQISIINNLHQCITPAEISRILFENFENLEGALEGLMNYTNDYLMKETIKNKKDEDLKIKVAVLEMDAKKNDTTDVTQLHNDDEENKFSLTQLPSYKMPNSHMPMPKCSQMSKEVYSLLSSEGRVPPPTISKSSSDYYSFSADPYTNSASKRLKVDNFAINKAPIITHSILDGAIPLMFDDMYMPTISNDGIASYNESKCSEWGYSTLLPDK